jgi:hypothetical protein
MPPGWTGQQRGPGHVFNDVHAHDHAYIHNGDVYSSYDAGSEERRIIDWLAPQNPSEDHHEALKRHEEGTLKWFFQDDRFTDWRDGGDTQKPQILWCRGKMGTGKTTLVAQIREHLHARESIQGSLAIAYCRYSKRNIQTAETILGSILAQLYDHDTKHCDIPSSVRNSFETQKWMRPRVSQLEEWLQARLAVEKPVFVLLDAIDELDVLLVRGLLCVLQAGNLRLLITSRDIQLMRHEIVFKDDVFCTEILISATEEGLHAMALARLQRDSTPEFRRIVLEQPSRDRKFTSVKEEVIAKILHSTNYM